MTEALTAAENYAAAAFEVVRGRVAASSLDAEQHAAHGLAWIETAVEALRALQAWGAKQSGDAEALVVQIGTCETLTVNARRHRISIALDGEVLKLATPLKFSIRPGALTVFVPA